MKEIERTALSALRFDWAVTQEDVWAPLEGHVNALNGNVANEVLRSFEETVRSPGRSPLGVTILGQKGAGKTHLLSWIRHQVQLGGGYFFLVGLLQGKDFWQNIVHALLTGLRRPRPDGDDQLTAMLRRLGGHADVSAEIAAQLTGDRPLKPDGLDEFIAALRRMDPHLGRECQYTARALVLLSSADFAAQDTGESYLTSQSEAAGGEWPVWGIRGTAKGAQQIVWEISRLLAVTGATLLAVDQIDTAIAQTAGSADPQLRGQADDKQDLLLESIGGGLMELREVTRRTLTVVACFASSWELITRRAVASAADRFRAAWRIERIPTAEVARSLVAARFRPRFDEQHFTPPYATWPVRPEAFADAPRFTPRQLLMRIDAHIRGCLQEGTVTELAHLGSAPEHFAVPREMAAEPAPATHLSVLDERFAALKQAADTSGAVDTRTEDSVMPGLLSAALQAWIQEQAGNDSYLLDPLPGKRPALHARLHQLLDETTDDERHWAFRAIAGPHHHTVRTRIERVRVIAGLDPGVRKRQAFVWRTGDWSTGPVTKRKISEFEEAGGVVLDLDIGDLPVFSALAAMLKEHDPALAGWLRERQPAGQTSLFRAVFGAPEATATDGDPDGGAPHDAAGDPAAFPGAGGPDHASRAVLALGSRMESGTELQMPLEALRKHTVIFAGSGSGKTVLIRRLVEECALQGVSSIVLDPNNDLARLGEQWPVAPPGWRVIDQVKADEYFASTDVVVWTPRREAGRPLSFQPLPDFAAVSDDPDEFGLALDTGVAALAPRARMTGSTAKAERGRAVLREALAHFARQGGAGLSGFLDLLTNLPGEVTSLAKATAIAADMAQTLTAAMINDPLFGGAGVPLDPGVLLSPAAGRRARVSVISFIGLPTNEQRQSFVNQLQMALFAWIKRHPAADRPLAGLFVMDEAQTLAPSGVMTACTESTLALTSQARKYGLGLIFATQAPRGIHNRIAGNAATQFYGFLNSPVQIAAAKEMASAKASGVVDISRLTAGQFYAVGEGTPFQKVVMPMCLSYHPPSALTAEEIVLLARRSR